MLFQFYLSALAAALVVAGLFLLAGQSAGLNRDYGPLPVGHGVSVPPHTELAGSPPWGLWSLR
jgi:cytochrome c oxidase subunit I+III